MNPIMTETRSTQVTDYYTTTNDPEVDEASLAAQERSKTAGDLLHRQMKDSLQDFQESMTAVDATSQGHQIKKSVAAAETVKKGLGQYASQPGIDMNSLMLEMNGLLSKMRDLQRDHAIQQQQQALTMQEKAYEKNKESVEKGQSAAQKGMIVGFVGAGVGLVGAGIQGGSALRKGAVESKQVKVNELMRSDSKLTEEAAFSKLKEIKSGNWIGTPDSLKGLDKATKSADKWGSIAEGAGKITASATAPVTALVTMADDTASKNLDVEAKRDQGLQGINEKEQALREEQSRASSQQMRDVQREMNELYGKIASAVRW